MSDSQRWVIVEIMGHRVVAGRLVQGEPPYAAGVVVDIAMPDGSFLQEFYAAQSLFSVRIVPEIAARKVGIPYHVQEMARLALPAKEEARGYVRDRDRETLYQEIDEAIVGCDLSAVEDWVDALAGELRDLKDAREAGPDEYREQLLSIAACVVSAIEEHDCEIEDIGPGPHEDSDDGDDIPSEAGAQP